jgi:hypothetical protein
VWLVIDIQLVPMDDFFHHHCWMISQQALQGKEDPTSFLPSSSPHPLQMMLKTKGTECSEEEILHMMYFYRGNSDVCW